MNEVRSLAGWQERRPRQPAEVGHEPNDDGDETHKPHAIERRATDGAPAHPPPETSRKYCGEDQHGRRVNRESRGANNPSDDDDGAAEEQRRQRQRLGFRYGRVEVRASVVRVVSSVNVSDSFGMLVTNGPTSQPKPNGMPRVSEIDSHCT